MTLEYKREEIERLVDKVIPPDYEVQTENQGQRTGIGTIRAAFTLIAQVFSADPDTVLSLQKLAAERIAKLSSDNLARLQEINELLTAVSVKPTKLDTTSLRKIRDTFLELTNVSDSETKLDKLQQIVVQVEKTLSQISNSKAPLFVKGPNEAAARIHELLELYESDLATLLGLSQRFFSSIRQALNSGLFLDSSERHASEIVTTLDGILAQGDLGASDMLKSVAVTSVGLGVVDTTLDPVNPLAYKYSGGYSVVNGRPGFIVSTESFPVAPQGHQIVQVLVDGSSQDINVPAATAAQLSVTLPESLFPFPHTLDLEDGSYVKNPVDTQVFVKFAVNGVEYLGSKNTALASVSNLAAVINMAFGDTIAVAVGETLTVTSPLKGTKSSVAFFETATSAVLQDANRGLGLTYTAQGEARGSDVAFDDITYDGGAIDLSTSKVRVGSSSGAITSESSMTIGAGLQGGQPAPVFDVLVGDKAIINGGSYRVTKVEPIENPSVNNGFSKVFVEPVTPIYSSAENGSFKPPHLAGIFRVDFVREQVRATSQSTAFGVTSVVGTDDTVLGFPSNSSTRLGEHSEINLSSAVLTGSPIRLGDVLLDSSGNRFGAVQGANGKNLKVALDAGKTFPSGQINILALGAYSYRQLTEGVNLQLLNESIDKVFEEADLPQVLKQYVSSLSGREVLTDKLIAHLSAMTAIQSVYSLYTASMTKELSVLLSTMSESGMTAIKDMLLDLRIEEIRNLNTDSLSPSGKLSKSLGILENEVSQGEDFIQLSETQSTIPLDEYDPFDDDISDNELPYLDESETEEGIIDA